MASSLSSLDRSLPRYFDFLAADPPTPTLSFVDQILQCVSPQPFNQFSLAGREISLQGRNAFDDGMSERSSAALCDVGRSKFAFMLL